MYIKPDELVKKIARIAHPDYTGRKYKIEACDYPIDTRSYWDGGSRSFFSFVRVESGEVVTIPQQSAFDRQIDGLDKIELVPGVVCVVHRIFCGHDLGLTFLVHPSNAPAFLNAPQVELSPIQYAYLAMMASKTSAGRKSEMVDCHISPRMCEWLNAELSAIGLVKVNTAGSVSVTMDGKNARSPLDDGHSFWWQWRDSWQYCNDGRYHPTPGGFASGIIAEYKAKYAVS